MRRGGSLLISLLLLFAVFYGGRLYERNDCRIDLPNSVSDVGRLVVCR